MDKNEIMKIVSGFQASRVLLSAVELDIFTILSEKQKTAKEISAQTGYQEEGLERIMNVLVSMGFLGKKGDIFSNTESSEKFLVKSSPDFLGGIMHSNNKWNSWSALSHVVKNGKDDINYSLENKKDEVWLENFIRAMHERAKNTADDDIKTIDLTNTKSVLDIGGGSGVFSMAFKKVIPDATISVFDLSSVIPISKKFIAKEGFEGKINTIHGNYMKDNFQGKYDLIFLSAIVHINSYSENLMLIKKCSESLNSGGQIVIRDFITNEDKTAPLHAAMFGINMLVGTKSGNVFSEKEVIGWFENAGINFTERNLTISGVDQIIGRKM